MKQKPDYNKETEKDRLEAKKKAIDDYFFLLWYTITGEEHKKIEKKSGLLIKKIFIDPQTTVDIDKLKKELINIPAKEKAHFDEKIKQYKEKVDKMYKLINKLIQDIKEKNNENIFETTEEFKTRLRTDIELDQILPSDVDLLWYSTYKIVTNRLLEKYKTQYIQDNINELTIDKKDIEEIFKELDYFQGTSDSPFENALEKTFNNVEEVINGEKFNGDEKIYKENFKSLNTNEIAKNLLGYVRNS